jgi:hypothetical protein
MLRRSNLSLVISTTLLIVFWGHAEAAKVAPKPADPPPPGILRTESESYMAPAPGLSARAISRAPAVGETVYVFSNNMNSLSSPNNEGGFKHEDQSAKPTAWHIDTRMSCPGMNHSWWCGRVDSLWIYDSNRAGYDNDWIQFLQNSVDLTGVPANQAVTIGFRHHFDAEPLYDFGYVDVFDFEDGWVPLTSYTGRVPSNGGCDSVTLVVPDSIRADQTLLQFRFRFESDVAYSSADGLYDGDGWSIDNITVKAGTDIRFFDNCEGGIGAWYYSTYPGVGDYFYLNSGVFTEDICVSNATKLWTDWDPVVQSLVPRLDNLLSTPPIFINHASDVFVEFDVYRNLPLASCFYYHLNFRTKNAGDPNWSLWQDPTFFVYYGSSKDWARQRIPLPGAGNHDSVQVQLGLRDYSITYCDGVSSPGGVYALFDNVALGVIGQAPPSWVVRDIDLFNDTFQTTPFFANDNFNSPVGDSVVVQVNASFGYKNGFMHYRMNGGSFTAAALTNVSPALKTRFSVDVPAGSYPANTHLEYYFSATDSLNNTSYYPPNVLSTQKYLSATILPRKTATNPALGCFDSLATILFVNHFSGREPATHLATALSALGHKFDTWDVNGPTSGVGNCLGGSDPSDPQYHWPTTSVNSLLHYKTIIWHSGDLTTFTITPQDQAIIQSWIQQQGSDRNFWIAGDDVANELATQGKDFNSFLAFTAGVNFIRNTWENTPQDTLRPLISGVLGSPTAGRAFHLAGGCPLISKYDLVSVSGTAQASGKTGILARYPNNLGAMTRYATKYFSFGTDSARSVFQAFSFNDIEEGGERLQLTKSIMQTYFKNTPCYFATAVEENPVTESPGIPTRLFQNVPNPFNPSTEIRYAVGRRGRVEIDIFNVAGARVRRLVEGDHEPGTYRIRWDGTDDSGHALASGAYFYRFRADGKTDSKKLMLLK